MGGRRLSLGRHTRVLTGAFRRSLPQGGPGTVVFFPRLLPLEKESSAVPLSLTPHALLAVTPVLAAFGNLTTPSLLGRCRPDTSHRNDRPRLRPGACLCP